MHENYLYRSDLIITQTQIQAFFGVDISGY
jgi:hypothetical protein